MCRTLFLFLFLFLFSLSGSSQVTKADYYNKIDNKVFTFSKKSPDAPFDSITTFVNHEFKTSEDRARAYYTWIALNISYDVEHLNEMNLMQVFNINSSSTNQKGKDVLRNKKAVCEGYSNLMVDFCASSSIPCYMVCGYTKTPNGDIPEILHAWNVLRIDSVWTFVDITWSSGYMDYSGKYVKRFSNLYFLPKAKNFVKDHLPLDPMWELLKNPFTKHDFEKDSLTISHSPVFNFPDSLRAYVNQTQEKREYLNFLHYYRANPDDSRHAKNLDILNNNTIADQLNRGVAYHKDFMEIANKKLSKKPNLADCKKARVMLDSVTFYNNEAQSLLLSVPVYTTEYKDVFVRMQNSIDENKKGLKTNYDNLNKLQAYLKKK